MSPRVASAVLALVGAILLASTVVGVPWSLWGGPPEVDGRVMHKKEVFVGPLGAEGCNTGGDGHCEALAMPGAFTKTGYLQAGASGLLALVLVVLALLALANSDKRKVASNLVFITAAMCAVVAIALIVQGPKILAVQRAIKIPIGIGMYLFWGSLVVSILASVLARRPTPKLALRSSRQPLAPGLAPPPAQAAAPVDVLALFQEDPLRPAAPDPEPPMGRPGVPPSPGGMLPGPAGPLGVGGAPPLFAAAPQLRPLYDAPPAVGGTGGLVPGPQPDLRAEPPAAVPRDPVGARAGTPAPPPASPPPIAAPPAAPPGPPRPRTASAMPPPLLPPTPMPGGSGLAAPAPAPLRGKPLSVPPPMARTKAASVVPPPRASAPSVPPPLRGKPASLAPPTKKPTIGMAVVPPPAQPFTLPTRAATDPSDHLETMDREAATLARGGTEPGTDIGPDLGERTDANMVVTGLEPTQAARPMTDTDVIETLAREKVAPEDVARPSASELPTTAHPKIPVSTAPDSLPPPAETAVASGPAPACPQCDAPMAWVEEHLRFYCKSCRMYF